MVQVPSFLIHCPGQSSGEAPLKELGKDRCSWEKQHQQQMFLQLAPGLCLPQLWELSTPPNLCCLQMNECDLTSLLEKQVKNSSTLCLLQLSEEKATASLRRRNHLEHSRFITQHGSLCECNIKTAQDLLRDDYSLSCSVINPK